MISTPAPVTVVAKGRSIFALEAVGGDYGGGGGNNGIAGAGGSSYVPAGVGDAITYLGNQTIVYCDRSH